MSEHQEEKKQEVEEEKAEEGSASEDESDEEKHSHDSPTRPPSSPPATPPAPGQQDEERDEAAAAAAEESATAAEDGNTENNPAPVVRLYKSSRFKGYITLTLASFINYDAAQKSADVLDGNISVVPSTSGQRGYAVAVAVVSLIVSVFCLVTHLDRITPLQKFWSALFRDGSRFEGVLLALWSLWWAVGTGVATAVTGIAGDGKGQYSLYYSYWVCCLTTLWALERWWVAAGWVSVCVCVCFARYRTSTNITSCSEYCDVMLSLSLSHSLPHMHAWIIISFGLILNIISQVSDPLFPVGPTDHRRGSAFWFLA